MIDPLFSSSFVCLSLLASARFFFYMGFFFFFFFLRVLVVESLIAMLFP